MIWLLAALDLAAGLYLLRRALPRQRRDRDLVLAVGMILLVCAAALAGIGVWHTTSSDRPLPPVKPVPGVSV